MVVYMLSAYRHLIDGGAIIFFPLLIFNPWEYDLYFLFDANYILSHMRYVFLL